MEKNLFQTAEDFAHRLNMSGFTNIEKSYTSEDFQRNFAESHLIFEKSSIDNFIKNVANEVGGEIIKGKFNDTPEVHAVVEKAKSDLSKMQKVLINDGPGMERYVFVIEKSKMTAEEDTFEKGKDGDELEKGKLTDAFEYSDKIIFKKKGSDIIAQFNANKTLEEARKEQLEKDIEDALDTCCMSPTEKPSLWGMRENITVPYKMFNWNQTYYSQNNNMHDTSDSDASCRPCNTPEEAEENAKYNSLVNQWIDCCVEIRMIDLYSKNLDEKKEYELTSRQMLALKF